MAKKPEPPKPISRNVYNMPGKAVWLGDVGTPYEAAAIEKAAGRKAGGDTEMTRRKGEITRGDLKRKWPHHVALPGEKMQHPVEVIFCAASVLSLEFLCSKFNSLSWRT